MPKVSFHPAQAPHNFDITNMLLLLLHNGVAHGLR
jgi:hypothetical protein